MSERRKPTLSHTEDVQAVLAERKAAGLDKPKRKVYPSEKRRRGRVIGPTLSAELIDRLREVCAAAGYVNTEGDPVIASAVIEVLLSYAVEAHDAGDLELPTVNGGNKP